MFIVRDRYKILTSQTVCSEILTDHDIAKFQSFQTEMIVQWDMGEADSKTGRNQEQVKCP